MHIRDGYREKLANLQCILKLHVRFYNRISKLQGPCNKNWHAHYSLRARSIAINASMAPWIHLVCTCKSLLPPLPSHARIFQQYLQHTWYWWLDFVCCLLDNGLSNSSLPDNSILCFNISTIEISPGLWLFKVLAVVLYIFMKNLQFCY